MFSTPLLPKDIDYDQVYEPAEDSFLLLDVFEKDCLMLKNHKFNNTVPLVVEIGIGSGIVTTFIHKYILQDSIFIGTDLNPFACKTSVKTDGLNIGKEEGIDAIQSDLVFPFITNSIDLLVFNPPYVPTEFVPPVPSENCFSEKKNKWLDLALDGGSNGMVITNNLLKNLKNYISKNGLVYLLFCERNNPTEVIKNFIKMENFLWEIELVLKRKCGWEVLSVYRFKKLV
ncbi:hypothetical protein PACTADRAFT_76132 [Pachysolen tannophilus NRRL Y-2460]|uniref:Methyltransferase small domain-containing protein n=1 Tax=Pachysolen tannophilus NRRL Y-2460 TaxID=669874 RepID=A0A1E4TVB0_PACTA|nr:hypothetical protein PACTADRAFT_76132 [Pachysolen tannophilus NRRL Y-2460]